MIFLIFLKVWYAPHGISKGGIMPKVHTGLEKIHARIIIWMHDEDSALHRIENILEGLVERFEKRYPQSVLKDALAHLLRHNLVILHHNDTFGLTRDGRKQCSLLSNAHKIPENRFFGILGPSNSPNI